MATAVQPSARRRAAIAAPCSSPCSSTRVPPGCSSRSRRRRDTVHHIQPVRSPVQRDLRVVQLHLEVARDRVARDVRRVRDDHVDGAVELAGGRRPGRRAGSSRWSHPSARGFSSSIRTRPATPRPRKPWRAAPRSPVRRRWRRCRCRDRLRRAPAPAQPAAHRQRTAPPARSPAAARKLPGRRPGPRERKYATTGDVLERFAGHPAVEHPFELVELVAAQLDAGDCLCLHLAAAEVEHVPDQQVGVCLGGRDAGIREPHDREVPEGGERGHSAGPAGYSSEPMSASRASSSNWMHDSTTGSRAPFITWSRLYAL